MIMSRSSVYTVSRTRSYESEKLTECVSQNIVNWFVRNAKLESGGDNVDGGNICAMNYTPCVCLTCLEPKSLEEDSGITIIAVYQLA